MWWRLLNGVRRRWSMCRFSFSFSFILIIGKCHDEIDAMTMKKIFTVENEKQKKIWGKNFIQTFFFSFRIRFVSFERPTTSTGGKSLWDAAQEMVATERQGRAETIVTESNTVLFVGSRNGVRKSTLIFVVHFNKTKTNGNFRFLRRFREKRR